MRQFLRVALAVVLVGCLLSAYLLNASDGLADASWTTILALTLRTVSPQVGVTKTFREVAHPSVPGGEVISTDGELSRNTQRVRRFKVLGAPHSGADYVQKLLSRNLQAALAGHYWTSCSQMSTAAPSGQATPQDEATLVCDDTNSGFLMHELPNGTWVEKLMMQQDTVIIAVVRSPFAHIGALAADTSELQSCAIPPHYGFPLGNCTFGTWFRDGQSSQGNFSNIADVIYAYIDGYMRLQRGAPTSAWVVPLETATLQPEHVVRKVFHMLELENVLPSTLAVVGQESHLKEQIETRSYMNFSMATAAYIAKVCSRLEFMLLKQIVVPTVPNRTYFDDCVMGRANEKLSARVAFSKHVTSLSAGAGIASGTPQTSSLQHPMTAIRHYPDGHPYANLKRLKVMGTWNSGTNFIHRLLRINLEAGLPDNGFVDRSPGYPTRYPTSCERFMPGITPAGQKKSHVKVVKPAPLLCDDTWSGSGLHKHTFPSGRWVDLLMQESNTVVVAMVRNPIAHLGALQKAPYDFRGCMSKPFYGRPGAHCMLHAQLGLLSDGTGNSVNGVYTSAADFVQQFMKRFVRFRDTAAAKVLVVIYEEAVLQPEVVVRRVFEALGFGKYVPSPIIPFDQPAKEHGAPTGTQAARRKIELRDYLKSRLLTKEFINASCAEFDRPFMEQFIVPTEPPRSFYSDCQVAQ